LNSHFYQGDKKMSLQNQINPNGVNVDQLMQTVNAIKENPDLARFNFRATTKWMGGGHSQTTIKGFYGAGQEDTSRTRPFVMEGDEPPILLGNNKGPNAVESVLQALASCLMVGFSYNAAAQGINVRSIEFDLDGESRLSGSVGSGPARISGYQAHSPNGLRCTTGEGCRTMGACTKDLAGSGHPEKSSSGKHCQRRPVERPDKSEAIGEGADW